MLRVEMLRYYFPVLEIMGHTRNLGQHYAFPVHKKALALMLAESKIMSFLFTRDYDNARGFYEGKLGFQFVSLDQFALALRVGSNMIRISKIPDFKPAQGTVLGWEVQDIEAVVVWLKERGVALEDYPFIQDRKLGIWNAPGGSRVAWFQDPDGNVLSVSQHT
jgi:predicted enzyme related to lactoylglutathione lyase